MSTDTEHPEVPPGPADAELPRRALARLAVSQQAHELAERAGNALVPTSTEYAHADDAENVAIAFQLVEAARELLSRAVIEARERGISWETIGAEHGDITRQSAQERYGPALAEWHDALDRPTERSGPFLSSRLPDGLEQPERTAARLDAWAQAHVAGDRFSRQRAEADGRGLVSAGLEEHSALTRLNAARRYREHLHAREQAGETIRAAEWDRLAELKTTARAAAEAEQHASEPESEEEAPRR